MRLQRAVERVRRKKHRSGRQQRPRLVAAQEPVPGIGVLPEPVDGRADVADEGDGGVLRQIVSQRGRRFEEQRQVILDAAGHDAIADVLVQRRARRIALEDLAIARAEARAPRLVLRKFARGQQAHVGHGVERALGVDIERPDALDVGIEKVEPERQGAAHGKEVDQPAAHAELARRDDLRDMPVAGQRHLGAQRIDVEPRALLQKERERRQVVRRREPVERGRRGDDEHVAFAVRDMMEGRQPLRDEILVR